MSAETDKFVVATLALWAGDMAHVRALLSDVKESRTFKNVEAIASPEELLDVAAALRLRQLGQKRGEFSKLTGDLQPRRQVSNAQRQAEPSLRSDAIVLRTDHLRAAVWRLGGREFVANGYLSDLAWEDSFYQAVSELDTAENVDDSPGLIEPSALERIDRRRGGSWVIEGDVLCAVDVTDMGIFEIHATWTAAEALTEFGQIREAVQGVLDAIESGVSSSV